MYEVVVGFEGRIKWRRQILAVQEEIHRLMETQAKAAEASEKAQAVAAS